MAGDGDDLLFFNGTLGTLTTTLVNPYNNESISINDVYNINRASYDGLGGIDTLLMTNMGDALFLFDTAGNQVVNSVEVFLAGDGGDIIMLADHTISYSDTTIFGGTGDDILWSNTGNDTISGGAGDDNIDGGAGNDSITGDDGNDDIYGGDGNDTLDGGTGNNILRGGAGADTYVVSQASANHNTIIETKDGSHNEIDTAAGVTQTSLTFTVSGQDLNVAIAGYGDVTIQNEFGGSGLAVDTIRFADGSTFDLHAITPPNQPPVAQNDDVHGNENQTLTGNVLADNGHGADADPDGGALSVAAGVTATAHGSVNLLSSGDFTYTPNADYFGTDGFTYTLLDGQGGSASATVNITLDFVNTPPVAQNDDFSGYKAEDIQGNLLADNGHGVDSDADNDVLSVIAGTLTTAHNGHVTLLSNGDFTYAPDAGYSGADSFNYTLSDGHGGTAVGLVSLELQVNVINGTAGNDVLNGTAHADTISGGAGADLLVGGAGDDTFIYNADSTWTPGFYAWNAGSISVHGTDIYVPIEGMNRSYDQFEGGSGNNTLIMTGGNDAFFLHDDYSARPDGTSGAHYSDITTIYAGDGNDVVDLTSPTYDDANNVTIYGGDGNDYLWSSTGNDVIYGGNGDDYLWGGGGDDKLYGEDGNDLLFGSVDNDLLVGGAGNDTLYGESGDDILVVGQGADQIYGGTGHNQIVYDSLDNQVDTIHGFQTGPGGDALNLTDILDNYNPATDAISNFVQLVNEGGHTDVQVNADGAPGGTFTTIAAFDATVTDTLTTLIANGNIVVNQHVDT